MKKTILAAGVLALLGSTAAQAADVVTYQEPPMAAPAPVAVNWTGFYAGATLGGSWGEGKTSLRDNGGNDTAFTTVKKKVKPETFMGGLYAGYNFETASNIIWGIETDFLWNDKGDSGSIDYTQAAGGGDATNTYGASVKQKWNGATRLRVGYAMGQEKRFLPYIAGGVSYAKFNVGSTAMPVADATADNTSRFSDDKTRTGWNAGIGFDYVPPIMNDHLVLRAEYRYTDFGKEDYNKGEYVAGSAATAAANLKQKVDYTQNDFRVGVAYKF